MDEQREVSGFYGNGKRPNPCIIFIFGGWYVVEGSQNVNYTDPASLVEGVNVEGLVDQDGFRADIPIESIESLVAEVEDFES